MKWKHLVFCETSLSVTYLLPLWELQVVNSNNIKAPLWVCVIQGEMLPLIPKGQINYYWILKLNWLCWKKVECQSIPHEFFCQNFLGVLSLNLFLDALWNKESLVHLTYLRLKDWNGTVSQFLSLCFWCQGVVTDPSPQTAAPSSQDASGQQSLSVENTGDHATAYSYQQSKWVL